MNPLRVGKTTIISDILEKNENLKTMSLNYEFELSI